ncbi:peptidoglycan hydrolase-like protein with peptidoglycan-binding domain [Ochrobactrum sp. RC6B]|nr:MULTISPECIES: DUF4344 domain-containing metallopeptidase [Brucella/Ochrobactrum group]MBA8846383.1 peptidoglycan hydrolase-like protein with peptidoglycan-binding domain [Ochrobactrum sp. RH1CCR137]MBA8858261.1 peptidoglycan hydrolase-like protein with peptidoglycan-binding domain [Ochrobactrum sp. RH1CCR134]MBB3219183.1 peptidoglycan hydrolase-like protein with peptidoglycan-binding domain [Ochrobactrum sp. RC6B]
MDFAFPFRSCKLLLTLALPFALTIPTMSGSAQGQTIVQNGSADPASIEESLNIWERRLVQEGLVLTGYYNGFADGEFGPISRNAIASYQKDRNRPPSGRVSGQDALELSDVALKLRKQLQWGPLTNSLSRMTLSYPSGILTQRNENTMGGETLQSGDGTISLKTARLANSSTSDFDLLYNRFVNEDGSKITYKVKRPQWFIVSGTSPGRKFYTRFEVRGNEVRGYDLSWNDDEDSKLVDNISVLISNSFHPFGENSSDGDPSYPTLIRLANAASAGAPGTPSQERSTPTQSNGADATQSSQPSAQSGPDGLTEQREDALPPPTDGSLITTDGKGLRFVYHYFPPQDAKLDYAYKWASETHLFLNIPEINALDGLFVTPRQLHYVTRQCNTINAFYDRQNSAIFLCYEMIDDLLKMGQALSKDASDPEGLAVEFVKNNLRFILLHESGHALIDLLDIPAVGREEDSVDQLAAVLLLMGVDTNETRNDIARVLQLASVWFKVNSQLANTPDVNSFADEHSLDAQRYFNLLCIVYGRDPENNRAIVDNGMLPKDRAARCQDESSKISRSWARLTVPHFSPRFKPKADDGQDPSGGTATRQPPSSNPLEWDGRSNPFAN